MQVENIYTQAHQATTLVPSQMTQTLRSELPLNIDPTRQHLAYGLLQIPKLVSEMDSIQLVDKQRALVLMSQLLHDPQTIALAIKEKIIRILSNFLVSKDLVSRQKASECIALISRHHRGRLALLEANIIGQLGPLFKDENTLVKWHCSQIVLLLSAQKQGADQAMQAGLYSLLIQLLNGERMDLQASYLEIMRNMIRSAQPDVFPKLALETKSLDVLTDLASKSLTTQVVVGSCECIMMLCFYHELKAEAVQSNVISPLGLLLRHNKSEARAAAAGALMTISINCEAKKQMVREGHLDTLVSLLDDKNEVVLLNAIKAIENVAEDYRARFSLNMTVPKMEQLSRHVNENVGQAARNALGVINWRP
ncbi:armadillo-type protein [Gorgonomyces haynaldii]|nr:armadillo-type protein [Gorgonomyces haynaldii]